MSFRNRQSGLSKKIDAWLGIPLVICLALVRPLLRRKSSSKKQKILIIKLSAFGDVVVMLPALYRLSESLPDAEFIFLGGDSNQALVKMLPFIQAFKKFSISTVFEIIGTKYDFVIDFDQWVRATAVISSITQSKNTFGFRTRNMFRHYAYDHKFEFNLNCHIAENFWNLANQALIITQANSRLDSSLSFKSDVANARSKFQKIFLKKFSEKNTEQRSVQHSQALCDTTRSAEFVIIHPGCGTHGEKREWPVSSWRLLIEKIREVQPLVKIFITGSGLHECKLALELETGGRAKSLVDQINLFDLCSLLSRAKNIYCGNTGVMHLASLLSNGLVALHGPTNAKMWGPLWGGSSIISKAACSPCLTWGHDYGCSEPICMKMISVKEVL
jgi:heptosyltransferase-3